MFRNLVSLVAFLLISASAYAQPVAIRNDNLGLVVQGTNGKQSYLSVTDTGAVLTRELAGATSMSKAEDAAHANGDVGVYILAVREDALTTSTGATNEYASLKTDGNGRLITTGAPPGETWQACGTATAVTSDVAIRAAVASNRIYVTSISCKNTSATVASSLDFKDGATIISVGGIAQMAGASSGDFIMVFNTPLRGSINTAFNFATNIAVTSVTCCANGYLSVL